MAVVGLDKTLYQVSGDVGMVEVCAIVYSPMSDCPIEFPFDVRLTNLTFGESDTRQCTEIPIVDDMIVELTDKSFFVTLERTPGLDSRITLDPVDGRLRSFIMIVCTLLLILGYFGNNRSMGLFPQRLWWVWRGHPIQSLRVWVWWRCVLLYTAPVSIAPLITPSMSDSQLMMVPQVMCENIVHACPLYIYNIAFEYTQFLLRTMVLCPLS